MPKPEESSMKNAIVRMDFRLDLPEAVVAKILERSMVKPDDGSEGWHSSALGAIEAAVSDDPAHYLEYAADEPDVEADA